MKVEFRHNTFDVKYIRRATSVDGEIGQIDRVININSNLKPDVIMEAEIHEALHACLPDMAEDAVGDTGRDIAAFLWRRGYRRR